MIQVLENNINLCDSCKDKDNFPYCPANENDILYGTGIGNDNICCCNKYCTNVAEVMQKRGKWYVDGNGTLRCSECKEEALLTLAAIEDVTFCESNFCPNCGAKMEKT